MVIKPLHMELIKVTAVRAVMVAIVLGLDG